MKLLSGVAIILLIYSCNNQQSAYTEAIKTRDAINAARPGTISTSPEGYTMTAKIDGEPWEASAMMPVELAGRIAGYYEDQFMTFPRFEKKFLKIGKKEIFRQENAVQLSTGKDKFFSGYVGEMVVTKLTDEWMEATFYFTGTDNSLAPVKVTDGFVRVKF